MPTDGVVPGTRSQGLIQIRAGAPLCCASSTMPPTPPTDPAQEAADLLNLASWYRCWADLASNVDDCDDKVVELQWLLKESRK